MSAREDMIANGDEALRLADGIDDRAAGALVRQGLLDLLSARVFMPEDSPIHLDMLVYARCLEAIYADRTRIVALASGAPSPIDLGALRARVAAAEAAGALKRGAEALAHCEALPRVPVRELLCFGLATSAELLAASAPIAPPVDLALQARLLEGSFRKTSLIKLLAEGKEPLPFI